MAKSNDWPPCPTPDCEHGVCLWAGTGLCHPCSIQFVGSADMDRRYMLAREIDGSLPVPFGEMPEGVSRQGLAAFCLYGQPFGFTRQDVVAIRETLEHQGCNCGENECSWPWQRLMLLADRIEALLPEEGE